MGVEQWFGVCVALLCFAAAWAARPLLQFNLAIYRIAGFKRCAAAWEARLGWWVPAVRVANVVVGAFLLVHSLRG